jgi:microcompartment protein CcmL/EutN
MEEAVGILEVYGLVCAFMAADSGLKAGAVRLDPFDKNKPANAETLAVPLLVTVKFRGPVSDVYAAMAAAEETARAVTGVVQRHVIPAPTADAAKLFGISGFDKPSNF